jgi:hypothetical protein
MLYHKRKGGKFMTHILWPMQSFCNTRKGAGPRQQVIRCVSTINLLFSKDKSTRNKNKVTRHFRNGKVE